MITADELINLISDLESDRIERTTSVSNTDKFSQAVCAFSNDFPQHKLPGYLLIGVNDDGSFAGHKITDQLLQNLGAIRSDGNILPIPALSVAKYTLPEGDVAVVEVQPSDLPPVRYKGRIYIRVGPRKAIANEHEERILSERRISFARSFDATPCRDSELKDLIFSFFLAYQRDTLAEDVIESNNRHPEEQLASLRFFDLRYNCPTYGGILLFGKKPRFFLPGSYVQYLKIDGNKLSDTITDQAEISGDLLSVLRELDIRIKTVITNKYVSDTAVSVLRETLVSDYPLRAIRELMINAVMHRDYQSNTPIRFYCYQDRIEIQNPGGLYGEVTPENYTKQNSYRNPVLAEALKTLGYVNRYGYGIVKAQALLADNENPPAEFNFEPGSVQVIIRKRMLQGNVGF